ncbi:hypothetical protein DDE23_17705 [Pararhodobacter aggregans]|uniref:DUF306 domain-containing protein n=2 Tax=Pararhodobacter aggregans TaxID=404875 RepID=A0A2T7UMW4_9RHOB|nr:hypothetical protein DDE23_17705 [Pararhodobacter aggregans]
MRIRVAEAADERNSLPPGRSAFKNRPEPASLPPHNRPRDADGKGYVMKSITVLVAGAFALLPLGAGAEDAPREAPGVGWAITAVSGAATVDEPAILFEEGGRVSGTSGCNRFGGEATQEGSVLTLGPLASTRMACPGALGEQEQAIFSLLGQPLEVVLDLATAGVTLIAPDGGSLSLQRQP